jgi:hypothetical protein
MFTAGLGILLGLSASSWQVFAAWAVGIAATVAGMPKGFHLLAWCVGRLVRGTALVMWGLAKGIPSIIAGLVRGLSGK